MDILKQIIAAQTRREIITIYINQKGLKLHLRQISRVINKQVNAVSRELHNLLRIGFLKVEREGKKKLFILDENFYLLDEFERMIYKTTGLGAQIYENLNNLGKIDLVIMTENYITNSHKEQYDIDLLLVGDVDISSISKIVKQVETESKREIKFTVLSSQEFIFRKRRRDSFIEKILNSEKIILIGKEFLNQNF